MSARPSRSRTSPRRGSSTTVPSRRSADVSAALMTVGRHAIVQRSPVRRRRTCVRLTSRPMLGTCHATSSVPRAVASSSSTLTTRTCAGAPSRPRRLTRRSRRAVLAGRATRPPPRRRRATTPTRSVRARPRRRARRPAAEHQHDDHRDGNDERRDGGQTKRSRGHGCAGKLIRAVMSAPRAAAYAAARSSLRAATTDRSRPNRRP